jgi:hypothetical protein
MIRVSIFSNDLCLEGVGFAYIAQSLQREPLDQTNLRNGVDATLESVGNRHNNWETDGGGP